MVVVVTKDEALKLALEALKTIDEAMPFPVAKLAIKECKAALEAKDEPVTENGLYRLGYHNGYGFGEAYGKANAPQRTWVGLTDEEIDKAWRSVDYTVPWDQHRIDIARAIEAKLREKNEKT
jgi:hypothetical protein